LADAAFGVAGDRLGFIHLPDGREPDVQHAVDGREEADVFSVRADARLGLVGVAEKDVARNKRRVVGRQRRRAE